MRMCSSCLCFDASAIPWCMSIFIRTKALFSGTYRCFQNDAKVRGAALAPACAHPPPAIGGKRVPGH